MDTAFELIDKELITSLNFPKTDVLEDKEAICYPGFEDKLLNAKISDKTTVVANNIITSKGMGSAIEFALTIVENFINKETAIKIAEKIISTY